MSNEEQRPASLALRCGIAGWSYADWQGIVYPRGTRDELRYIAGYVDLIEINSTFYHPPSARNAASWVRRTADLPDFRFTAKLHQDITHRGVIEPATVRAFHEGLAPLVEADRLTHLLAQFRWDFADTPAGRDHVQRIADRFGDITNLTIELRHNSWQSPRALKFLQALGVTVANLDYPTARNSFNLRLCTVGRHAYLRLHGRNAKAWFDRNAGRDETYDYLYSGSELDAIAARSKEIAAHAETLTIVANNHYKGKEVANALQLKAGLTGRKVAVPPGLAVEYPELNGIME